MADFHPTPTGGHHAHDPHNHAAPPPLLSRRTLATLTNVTGAIVSLSLIVGIGVWGYKLVVRDVSGIPVVRAAVGDMRIRPADPGGQQARNQGLSVNAVAAAGAAAGPTDQVVLAPRPVELTEEDLQPAEAAPVIAPAPLEVSASLDGDVVAALVRELTAPAKPAVATADADAPVLASLAAPTPEAAPAIVGELSVSLRPRLRPMRAPAASARADSTAPAIRDLPADTIAPGTRLVQLGAFDSAEVARTQWDKLAGRFADYLVDKNRVVQKAQSGGRTFYRLRAQGFEDLSDARRFCSALVAEGADCIPVVAR